MVVVIRIVVVLSIFGWLFGKVWNISKFFFEISVCRLDFVLLMCYGDLFWEGVINKFLSLELN
jgi:hypothetical protein